MGAVSATESESANQIKDGSGESGKMEEMNHEMDNTSMIEIHLCVDSAFKQY